MDFIPTIVCLIVIGTVTGNPARNRATTTTTTTTTALPTLTPLAVGEGAETSGGRLLGRCMENVTTSLDRENAEEMISSICQHYESIMQCADQVISRFNDQDKKNNGMFGIIALLFDLDSMRNAYRGFCADLPLITGSLQCLANNSGFDTCARFATKMRNANSMNIVEAKSVSCRAVVNLIQCAEPSWNKCGALVADVFESYYIAMLPPYCKQLTGVSSRYDTSIQPQGSSLLGGG